MDDLDCWRLCSELSIFQAAILIAGHDPSGDYCFIEDWQINERPTGYEPAKYALINGLKNKELSGDISYIKFDENWGAPVNTNEIDIHASMVSVDSLKKFLKRNDFNKGFFYSAAPTQPNYLNPENPFYASKLVAAIQAWNAVTSDESLIVAKTPKQALEIWLKEHAHEFGLIDEDGVPIKGSIEQVAKVANWKPEGGAAKTPNLKEVSSNVTPLKKAQSKHNDISDMDDEIPF